jgi:hypothetical protein
MKTIENTSMLIPVLEAAQLVKVRETEDYRRKPATEPAVF